MTKCLLAFAVSIPLCGQCQSYAHSPFYMTTSSVPLTAHVEGFAHGDIKANGVVIDLSESVPSSSPDFDEIRGWSVGTWVDRNNPTHTFHFYIQYDRMNPVVVFGYDLLVEPVKGTDKIKCTFSALTDPENRLTLRNKDVAPVALSADLSPVLIKSGDVISIKTLPLGEGKIASIHYLRLTRIDLTPNFDSAQ
ncbi:hypothetical protein P8935_21905 [Telmatobacter sp. DSM 110680]|uniref:Uncharacterized protein n=1 Tax=Telmatobacter sp. DSM 110680 TaxID=3036704 RepID=A0AAU7DIT8_9BACT